MTKRKEEEEGGKQACISHTTQDRERTSWGSYHTYEYTPTRNRISASIHFNLHARSSSDSNLAQALRNPLSILILLPRSSSKAKPFPPRTARLLLRAIMRALGTGMHRPRARTRTSSSLVKPRRTALRGRTASGARHRVLVVRRRVGRLTLDLSFYSCFASRYVHRPIQTSRQRLSTR